MSVSYLTQAELSNDLNANGNIDSSVVNAVINQLKLDGIYNNNPNDTTKRAWTEEGPYTAPTSGAIQVQDITSGGTSYVNTDPALKAIVVQTPSPVQIYVTDDGTHHSNVFVGLGTGGDSVNLYDGGNDTVQGGSSGDVIGGGAGNSLLMGGGGDDTIFGGSGNDHLIGGEGNNYLRVGSGHQLAEGGGSGNNTIVDLGDSGFSTLVAGTGNDTIYGYGGDTIMGGNSAGGSGHSELHGGINSYIESDSNASNYNLLGSGSTDASNANKLQGGAGADSLYGGVGHDTLIAGSGDQLLAAGLGLHQSLVGGSGNDLLQDLYSGGTDTLVAGASGNDTLVGMQGDVFDAGAAAGNTTFWVNGGGSGNSTLTGGSGDDTFHIETHNGNDTIYGGGGTNIAGFGDRSFSDVQSITGGSGNYVLTFNDGQQITTHGVQELVFANDRTTIPLP